MKNVTTQMIQIANMNVRNVTVNVNVKVNAEVQVTKCMSELSSKAGSFSHFRTGTDNVLAAKVIIEMTNKESGIKIRYIWSQNTAEICRYKWVKFGEVKWNMGLEQHIIIMLKPFSFYTVYNITDPVIC